jgi:hypothetical protein
VVRRHRADAYQGWAWVVCGILVNSMAYWILRKGEREFAPGDRTSVYALVGGLAAFGVPATFYGTYLLIVPETTTPLR